MKALYFEEHNAEALADSPLTLFSGFYSSAILSGLRSPLMGNQSDNEGLLLDRWILSQADELDLHFWFDLWNPLSYANNQISIASLTRGRARTSPIFPTEGRWCESTFHIGA